MVERRTPEQEVGVRNPPPPYCVLKQDTLLPESTGYTQEAEAPSQHDEKLLNRTFNLNKKNNNNKSINYFELIVRISELRTTILEKDHLRSYIHVVHVHV